MIENKEKILNIIISSVNKLVDFVSPTYGPMGNNIIVKRFGRIQAVDDGAIISEEFSLDDVAENDIIEFVRQGIRETNKKVEDGNVTTMLIIRSLLNQAKDIKSYKNLVYELKKSAEEAKYQLKKSSVKITTKEQISDVAKTAYNHKELADMLADIIIDIGKDGVILVEESSGDKIVYEKIPGAKFDRGYISSHLANNEEGTECRFDNPFIFITDKRIQSYKDVKHLLSCIDGDSSLVIISDGISDDALNFVVQNKIRGHKITAIDSPEIGERKRDFLLDLCSITGATLISIGVAPETITAKDFGRALRIISTEQETTIIGGKGTKDNIMNRVEVWKSKIPFATVLESKERIKRNIANLLGGVVVIKVGAATSIEASSHIPKIRNAISSAFIAYKGGVVAGAGIALAEINTSSELLNTALKEPRKVILINSEEKESTVISNRVKNLVTGETGYFMKVGVMDPVETLCACIDSAISIVCLLVKSNGIIDNNQ